MADLYQKNLKAAEKKVIFSQKKVEECELAPYASIAEDGKGQKVLCLEHEGYTYAMSSLIDADMSSECLAERNNDPHMFENYCLFGLGDGRAAEKIMDNLLDNNILFAIEPDIEVFKFNMQHFDYTRLFKKENFILLTDIEEIYEEFSNVIFNLTNASSEYPIRLIISPGYDVIYSEICRKCIDIMNFNKTEQASSRVTIERMNSAINENNIVSLPIYLRSSDLFCLKKAFEENDIEDVPAIIVAAGPSLDENIEDLRKAWGKALIIAVDSAFRTLDSHGVDYNIGITIDPKKPFSIFEKELAKGKPLISGLSGNREAVAQWKGRLFFTGNGQVKSIVENSFFSGKNKHPFIPINSGGSVATDAFYTLMVLGFKKIILVGQDLAYKGDLGHTSEYALEESKSYLDKRGTALVEGWNGDILRTDDQMKYYLKWFEKMFMAYKGQLEVIDATEGGAKKEGARQMTLAAAIDEYCKREIDFDRIIEECDYAFDDDERKEMTKELSTIEQKLIDYRGRLLGYKEANLKLKKLFEEGKTEGSAFKNTYKQVKKANAMGQKEKLYPLVSSYDQKQSWKFADVVADPNKSIEEVLFAGSELMGVYISNIDEIIKLIKKYWKDL
ncbi:motility associated factor glycosyltransferase family protein [Butyrivibrio sp. MC2013]|uniref:motility associated factor glycosyltransferase family protein n=1 Tax=Butyrivibrio sp. MC2013 TaxID=1280686 RepID=UPI0004089D08|nr:6-hydroxymethylpterin diphosphokinase MptE-like protein [Butyrivibrio sp. MC2013]